MKPLNNFIYHTGSVLDAMETNEYDAFAHGCNCFSTMGAGVAAQVKNRWPWLYEADKDFHVAQDHRLGLCSSIQRGDKFYFNLYSQYNYGSGRNLNYGALISSFVKAVDTIIQAEKHVKPIISFCIPRIGSGLAGGNWLIIEEILMYYEFDVTVDFNVYDLDKRKF